MESLPFLEEELAKLESAALRAQMNPHFLSNCLNSIQGFISNGERMKAMRYLSEFNGLLRDTLELSRQPLVTLEEDTRLLAAYLELEQMRFSGRFRYHIEVDSGVNEFDTEIPPMLIQPFVENAILHAFPPEEVPAPEVRVRYRQKGGELVATVTDNGIGIAESKARKAESLQGRRSFGMEIPEKRLQMLGGKGQAIRVEEMRDEEGRVLGTRVVVRVVLK